MKSKILSLKMLFKQIAAHHPDLYNDNLKIQQLLDEISTNEVDENVWFEIFTGKLILILKGKSKKKAKWNENILNEIFDILTDNF